MKCKSVPDPRLTKFGFERYKIDDSKEPNPDDNIVLLCRLFIREHCKKHSRINKNCDSYIMKHVAEKAIGSYVGNGEFIKAAMYEGYKIKYYPDRLTCDISMKCKSDVYSKYYSISDYQKNKEYI